MATSKKAFNPRALMEKAVEVMRESVIEPRKDGKVSPKVGAVLYKADGTIETACRGEIRYGDHAEFTLLERKHRAEKLDGSILFATLEPCAPGARNHPKLGCAERIVLARIKEVYVGIEDPDPTVDRKGIKYLQDHGITVHMFEADLQDAIRKENKAFLEQALIRAEDAEKPKELVQLSKLERSPPDVNLTDLNVRALQTYRDKLGLSDEVSSDAFHHRLLLQGLLVEVGGTLKPSGFGQLLFSEHPRDSLPQAGLKASVEYSNGEKNLKDFDGPLVFIPKQVEEWVGRELKQTVSRNSMERVHRTDVPFEVIREAVINALVHRDYDIENAKCHLIVSDDLIVIKSPGLPLESITLEQMNNFSAPTLSRNPILHAVFSRLGLAEERGLGMETWRKLAQKHELPSPRFSVEGPYLVLTIYRNPEAVISTIPADSLEKLSTSEREAWKLIVSKDFVTASEYVSLLGDIDRKTAQRHLKKFSDLGMVKAEGAGRSLKYKVLK